MTYRTVLSPAAKADMRSAHRWYRRIDRNLAFQFSLEGSESRSFRIYSQLLTQQFEEHG